MFTIAVCDDEQYVCAELEQMILTFSRDNSVKIDVQIYYSGEELYRALSAGDGTRPDLVFLDIELRLASGVEIGRRIREDLKDEVLQIVYISARQDYAMELFEVRPLHFLVKPLDRDKIYRLIRKAMELAGAQNDVFEFQQRDMVYRIPYGEIAWFESNNKKVKVITVRREYEFYGKLGDVAALAPREYFLRIHQSYLVNYLHVVAYNYTEIVMTTGKVLPISQPYQKEVRQWVMEKRRDKQ